MVAAEAVTAPWTTASIDKDKRGVQEPARYAALQQGNKGGALTGVGLEAASAPDGGGLVVRILGSSHSPKKLQRNLLTDARMDAGSTLDSSGRVVSMTTTS